MQNNVSRHNLVDMLTFDRVEFEKNISISVKKKVEIESKWEFTRLGDEAELITKGTTPTSLGFPFMDKGINFVKIESILENGHIDIAKFGYINAEAHNKLSRSQLKENDILFSIAGALGRTTIVSNKILPANTNQALSIIRLKNNSRLNINYTDLILRSWFIQSQIEFLKVGVAQSNLSLSQINDFKIPLPPLDIQQKIVSEIEVLEAKEKKAKEGVEKLKIEVNKIFNKIDALQKVSLDDISENLDSFRKPVTKGYREKGDIPYYGASGIVDYVSDYILDDFVLLISEDGANLKARTSPIAFTANGKIWVNNHAHILKFKERATHKLVEIFINKTDISEYITGQAQPKLNQQNLNNIKIPLPPLSDQLKIVAEIEKIEAKINALETEIASIPKEKETVLKKFL